ncbi:AraC family transcriptional regulator [Martelella radicis]|uniref:AraC family transcriptional regulator n=1 Tax=Martelella radicis TaxID=1397476 RepID=A0A7W6KIN5_9HYPH|nr:AraC family transcriptional regulator [Martelella radicis]MBB4121710.1 AraC family transcriptional regulator [Martelella radicis]
MTNEPDFQTYQQRLMRVSAYIHDHLDEELDFATLAEIACLSPWHWHRIYRGVHGETIAATVRRLRLHRAAGELVNSDAPVEAIARRAGSSGVPAFTRLFKTTYGITPASYRKNGRHKMFDQPVRQEESAMYDVKLRDMNERRLAGLPHRGSYMAIDKAFGSAAGLMAAAGAFGPETEMVGVYYDDPGLTDEKELNSFAGFSIAADAATPEALETRTLVGGRYAVLTHKGPYAELHKAYNWFYGSWLPAAGHEPADGPPCEIYRNDPRDTPPAELITEICVPLKG